MRERKKFTPDRRSIACTGQKVRRPELVSIKNILPHHCRVCEQKESLEMVLEISVKKKSLLEEQLIEEKNYYFDELLEWYECRQVLQKQNDALEKELFSQKWLSEAKIAGIVKAEKKEWEKEAQARIQSAVDSVIQQTIYGCNELLMPYTVHHCETLQNRRLVEKALESKFI